MWNFNEVVRIEYRKNYTYLVVFDDGVSGEVDFTEYLDFGPVFQVLRDLSVFRSATIEGGTIAWPNGADIAPETLYEKTAIAVKNSLQQTA
ncbi:MAG: DUF2442 domain-containing protein [Chitinivibrionales bacterium]|nr:DUF2442 domain-containing protein [Chitinivibrionales bacterium]